MAKATIDALFYRNVKAFELGHCFVCNEKCDNDSYCHRCCAETLSYEREKRKKEAWEKAYAEAKNK